MPFLSSIWLKLLLVAVLAGGIFAGYEHFVNGIKKEQITSDENVQLKQAMKDIQDLKDKTDALDQAQAEIVQKLNAKNTDVKTKAQTVQKYIASPEALKSNRESSDILKETVRRLSNDK